MLTKEQRDYWYAVEDRSESWIYFFPMAMGVWIMIASPVMLLLNSMDFYRAVAIITFMFTIFYLIDLAIWKYAKRKLRIDFDEQIEQYKVKT